MNESRINRTLTMIDIVLVLSLAIAILAWFFNPIRFELGPIRGRISWGVKPVLFMVLSVLVRVWFARKYHTVLSEKTRRRLLPKIALALFMVLFPLVITEYALAFAGVPAGEPVFVMHGQKGEAIRADGSMVNDADLLWRFEPGKEFNGRIVNAMGFLDRDVSEVKSQGVTRVICLGDSCSAQGVPPYSGHLNEMLKEQSPDETSWEAFNTAVHGYTVLQGLALYRTRVAVMSPDIVTIYFGWNDHWLAAEDDAERLARVGTPWITAMRNALVQKRMVALLAPRVNREKPDFTLRVPPDVYAGGLRDLIHAIRASGAEPLVLTAPRARTVHGHLVNAGHARSVEEALRLHDEYTDITRRIAREENTLLFDLAVAIKNPEFFSSDGIHFTDDGIREVARLIHGELMAWK